ncbi:LysR family transcriptional regulator [Gracilibacillus sp. S3-1-1]|uniref:LysR family transcriptional regulator n=1 Tax=Gracilibacillus pellucidus TaxID=3095368 RepID=A0ACC6M3J7_9BACI|nr:LysR family transcriptional regulator [Gracilibacillus sp. S3-1-1]MDX8045538.1 LysR family transcriptional regulator [Gracilibacillus sp. S3-1-1]
MNIATLQMFCLVVDVGSISQAAKLSYVSQPAVTKQIHQLESIYNTLLFDRKDGRLILTENGKVLYPFAKSIVEDFKRSKDAVEVNNRNYHESLKVGASLTIGEYLLPGFLGKFNKKNPDINISLLVENTPRVLEALANGVIDLALVEGIVTDKNLQVKSIAEDELILIHSPDHPWKDRDTITLQDLTHERMLWREPTSGTRLIIENFLKEYEILNSIENYMDLGSTQAIKSAVEANLGVSIVSSLTVKRELELGLLCETKIKDVEFKRNLWLVTRKQRFNKNSMKAFVEFIQI